MTKQRFWLILFFMALGSLIIGAMLHRHRAGIINLIPSKAVSKSVQTFPQAWLNNSLEFRFTG